MKVRLLIKGRVQGVGFRALIKHVGRSLGLKGSVRNLSDDSVEVYCEGPERLIKDFRKKLEYRGDPDRPLSLNVESITLHREDDVGYTNPPEEWEMMDIDYGDTLSTFEKEMLERTEIGSLLLVDTNSEVRRVGEKVDLVGRKVDSVGEKVDSVGEKVDSVGEKVDSVGEKVDSVGEKVDLVGRKVDSVGEKVDSVGGKMQSLGGELRELRKVTTQGFERLDKRTTS